MGDQDEEGSLENLRNQSGEATTRRPIRRRPCPRHLRQLSGAVQISQVLPISLLRHGGKGSDSGTHSPSHASEPFAGGSTSPAPIP